MSLEPWQSITIPIKRKSKEAQQKKLRNCCTVCTGHCNCSPSHGNLNSLAPPPPPTVISAVNQSAKKKGKEKKRKKDRNKKPPHLVSRLGAATGGYGTLEGLCANPGLREGGKGSLVKQGWAETHVPELVLFCFLPLKRNENVKRCPRNARSFVLPR